MRKLWCVSSHLQEGLSRAFLFLVPLAFINAGCVNEGAPIARVGRPSFVPQSSPDSSVETGIRPNPTGGISLQWFQTSAASGYLVYRTDSVGTNGTPTSFSQIANILSGDTVYTDHQIKLETVYYYCLKATASDGSQSSFSDTIRYEIHGQISVRYPTAAASLPLSNPAFGWEDLTGGDYTVVRVENVKTLPYQSVWVMTKKQLFAAGYFYVIYNYDSTATANLDSGGVYRWRIERFSLTDGRSYQGATSPWTSFTVN